jgi:hypothetical protein
LRFLHQLRINTPEIQVTLWFAVTLIGVALVSGRFFQWPPVEQFAGVLVLTCHTSPSHFLKWRTFWSIQPPMKLLPVCLNV